MFGRNESQRAREIAQGRSRLALNKGLIVVALSDFGGNE
jgi:hypothetical protein